MSGHQGVSVLGIRHSGTSLVSRLVNVLGGYLRRRPPHDFIEHLTFVERPETVMGCVDRAYPLGESGILLFGWHFSPKRKPLSISICDESGNCTDVASLMTPLCRMDVSNTYRQRFQNIDDTRGFCCLAPMPTKAGEPRALCFDFGEFGQTWFKVPTDDPDSAGLGLIKEMLGMIHSPERIRNSMFDVFDGGLGKAIEIVSSSRQAMNGKIEMIQYGTPADESNVTVVVPLYGRYDVLRHQLAHFTDDPEFKTADLIYVVDDPGIAAATLELAAKYYQLFAVPFRVVLYGESRGYAGAHNIGARFARGRYLVLLNSDVIPQHAGWLSTLRTALEDLRDAGAVGPLLQFGDGSVQHAGMYPRSDVLWPGFLLNTHRHMGMAWSGGDAPSEHPMLTAICIMLRTADFHRLGGLDEGYIIGGFEDSDLCLRLRKQAKRLYVVPAARLWHLERQSKNLDSLVGDCQVVRLFNAWRYTKKIRNGDLVDPTLLDVNQ